ncbi:DUF6233 domain-containing protein [Streptomyces sp. NBC_00654]|nr:DUF6233 domain-containing protein [Streptomyces sp. NBC_00654]
MHPRWGSTSAAATRRGERLKVISRDQALGALAEGIRACTHCRPDAALGMP